MCVRLVHVCAHLLACVGLVSVRVYACACLVCDSLVYVHVCWNAYVRVVCVRACVRVCVRTLA